MFGCTPGGMFGTGSFGVGSTFTTGLGTGVGLRGNPLLEGLVWIRSRTEPCESIFIDNTSFEVDYYTLFYINPHLNYDLVVKKLIIVYAELEQFTCREYVNFL
jgi:hypothetical protein